MDNCLTVDSPTNSIAIARPRAVAMAITATTPKTNTTHSSLFGALGWGVACSVMVLHYWWLFVEDC